MNNIDSRGGAQRDRWLHRALPLILFAVAVLPSAGVALGASAATAGAPRHPSSAPGVTTLASTDTAVRFIAPADEALVTSPTVAVRIQAASGVSNVRVWVGANNVSARFSRRGDVFTARLPRSLFKIGGNQLLAQANVGSRAGAAASASFVLGRPAARLLGVRTGETHPGLLAAPPFRAGPTAVSSALHAAGGVPVTVTSAGDTKAVLDVNGDRVSDLRAGQALEAHSWLVSEADGLRFGRNRFVLKVWNAKGDYTVKRWNVTRGRKLPLAEAGARERVVHPGHWTTLDGSRSMASHPGAKLSYAWSVVSSPNGAKGLLIGATTATPHFAGTVSGVYTVELRVTQHGRSTTQTTVGEDVTTLDVVPSIGPQGLYVDTGLFSQSSNPYLKPYNSLRIEGQTFTHSTNGNPDNWVQLDAATLAVVADGTHDQITPSEGTITIGQWDGVDLSDVKWDSTVGGAQYGSQVWLGTSLVASNYSVNGTDFSNVGNATTALHGWIEPAKSDTTSEYSWFGSDMLQVETRMATDTATTNTMEINGTDYEQTLPADSPGGFQLIVLGNDGSVVDNELYALSNSSNEDPAIENTLASKIESYPTTTATILLQAFGGVGPIPDNSPLANQIQEHGGRADVVRRFTGEPNATGAVYALIAGPSLAANSWSPGWNALEASYERTGAGSLNALLIRDSQDDAYIPYTGGASEPTTADSVANSFLPLAYSAPHSWTDWIRPMGDANGALSAPTAAESTAYSDMLAKIVQNEWLPSSNPCPNAVDKLRGVYCDTSASDLLNLKSDIAAQLPFDATLADGRYTETDWETVQQTIEDELADVINIRSSIATYQSLYGTSSTEGSVNVVAIGDAVKAELTRLTPATAQSNLGNLLSALSSMTVVIPGVGDAMSFISGAYSLATLDEPNTSPDIDLGEVTVAQDTAGSELLNAMQNANDELSTLGDYVVCGPGKARAGELVLPQHHPHRHRPEVRIHPRVGVRDRAVAVGLDPQHRLLLVVRPDGSRHEPGVRRDGERKGLVPGTAVEQRRPGNRRLDLERRNRVRHGYRLLLVGRLRLRSLG